MNGMGRPALLVSRPAHVAVSCANGDVSSSFRDELSALGSIIYSQPRAG
jgi:hypothetical protein